MISQTKNFSLNSFLSAISGQKEAGLMIAQDKKELNAFIRILERDGFGQSKTVLDLFNFQKTYVVADQKLDKDVYDFLVQYPTGLIEIFDKKLHQSQTLSPDHKNSALVILVMKDQLKKLQNKGFNLLGSTGPAYQS